MHFGIDDYDKNYEYYFDGHNTEIETVNFETPRMYVGDIFDDNSESGSGLVQI